VVSSLKDFNYNPKVQSVVIVGETQSGKTEHAITLTYINSFSGYDVLVLDLNWRFSKLDPDKIIHNIYDIKGKGLQILQPHELLTKSQRHQFFNDVCYAAYSYAKKGNFILVVDELQEWIEHYNKPIDGFDTYVRTCHNHHSSYIAIFQSTSEIPKYVLSNAIHKFVLYMDTPNNVEYMKKYVGKEIYGFARGEFEKYE